MKAPAIVSVLLALGAVIYLLLTEWTFWKGSDDKPDKPDSAEQATNGDKPDPPDKPDAPTADANKSSDGDPPTAPSKRRTGTRHYRVGAPCDCAAKLDYILETVTIDEQTTTLTLLNAREQDITTYPPGHEHAPRLLEWKYTTRGDKPSHDLVRTEGIGVFPAYTRARNFRFVFSRVADDVDKIQYAGRSTPDVVQFNYTSIPLTDEIDQAAWERFEAYKRCGFDGVNTVATGRSRQFVAHGHADASELRWSVGSQGQFVGPDSGARVTVQGQAAGKTELCLTARRGDASCESCADIEVTPAVEVAPPDFSLTTCGGFPSRRPNWRFAVIEPVSDATYEWSVSAQSRMMNSKDPTALEVVPTRDPGEFTVTLRARYPTGNTATSAMTLHNVYSCPTRGSVP